MASPPGWIRVTGHTWPYSTVGVAAYSKWEEVNRKKLQAAGNDGGCDLFGDLRHLRNDIVHHDSVATSGNAGKCKIVTHFQPDDQVFLEPEDVVAITDELAAWVESLGVTSQGRVHRDPEVATSKPSTGFACQENCRCRASRGHASGGDDHAARPTSRRPLRREHRVHDPGARQDRVPAAGP